MKTKHKKKRSRSFFIRLFFCIYTLFVIIFNCAMYLVIKQCYHLEVKQSKDRAASEQYNAANSLTRDFSSMEEQGVFTYTSIISDFGVYQNYYKSQGISVELFCDKNLLIDGEVTVPEKERAELNTEPGKQNILIRNISSESYVFAASSLGEPYDSYAIVIAYPLREAVKVKRQMLFTMAVIDTGVSLLLGVLLYLMLRHLMSPLSELSKATIEVADGNYDKKIIVKTEDEFGILADQFNRMSDSIAAKITELKEENQKKEMLINDMAHELRTPLTAMLGYSEYLLMADVSSEEQKEVLDHIIHETKRMSRLSDTLLYLARIHTDEIKMQTVSCKELQDTMRFLFEKRAEQELITLQFTNSAATFTANREMIEILLTNLIENAIRACNRNGHITVCFESQENDEVKLSVSDDGIGMEQEELSRIMQPFYRVDKARSRKNGGVGLGVTLCSQIAAYHKTSLVYESCPNKGTTVSAIFTT